MYIVNPAEAPSIIAANPSCKGVVPLLTTVGCGDANVEGGAGGELFWSAAVDGEELIFTLCY